jgi:ABC-type transport system involved in cytochrome c biogenesis permease component
VRGLWNLIWLEIKIFVREPMGFASTVFFPVAIFLLLGRGLGGRAAASDRLREFVAADLPVFTVMLMALNAVLSLVTIIAIYREAGILKRLRATPLRPHTILTAHVIVKLIFTAVTLSLMAVAGRKFYPIELHVDWLSFGAALIITTVSVLSLGFLIASLVPTARFAQSVRDPARLDPAIRWRGRPETDPGGLAPGMASRRDRPAIPARAGREAGLTSPPILYLDCRSEGASLAWRLTCGRSATYGPAIIPSA